MHEIKSLTYIVKLSDQMTCFRTAACYSNLVRDDEILLKMQHYDQRAAAYLFTAGIVQLESGLLDL